MNIFTIIALVCIVPLLWIWLSKSGSKVKGTPARTSPASRGKFGGKPR